MIDIPMNSSPVPLVSSIAVIHPKISTPKE